MLLKVYFINFSINIAKQFPQGWSIDFSRH